MHHGQSRGGKKTRKVCKKQVNLRKTGGEICKSRGERIIFAKQGGNSKFVVDDLKKRSSEILAYENQEIFREKVKLRKFSSESENYSKIGGKSETGGKCIMVSEGNGRPCKYFSGCVYKYFSGVYKYFSGAGEVYKYFSGMVYINASS